MISAVILAAGLSRRMGRPKQFLKLGTKTLLEHVVENTLQSKVSETIVVTGAHQREIKQVLAGYDVNLAHNPRYEEGQGTSVAAGAAAVSPHARGILFLLVDQPFICPQIINRMVDTFTNTGAPIVRSGETGHPVLFDITLKEQLVQLSGDAGGRQIINKYRDRLIKLCVCPYQLSMDIDTEKEYKLARAIWEQ
ncbi:MAG: nucleotidyltransferase family protein [Bacillota bacterium]|nr:nucleotidyltransferase family protein [Bacillota bacterium]